LAEAGSLGSGAVPTLSIVIPVHNEEAHLEQALDRVLEVDFDVDVEVVLVDDRSTDGSPAILARYAQRDDVVLLTRPPGPGGKGAALRDGFARATGDFIAIHDADLEYDPGDLVRLIQPLQEDRADVVYGSRFRREREQVHRTFHYLINRTLTLLSNLLSGLYLSDMETCHKVFRADLLKAMQLRSDRFGVEVEMTAYIAKARLRVFEMPISYFPRTRLAGKKISWRDGVAALGHLVRFNLMTSEHEAFRDLPERYRT